MWLRHMSQYKASSWRQEKACERSGVEHNLWEFNKDMENQWELSNQGRWKGTNEDIKQECCFSPRKATSAIKKKKARGSRANYRDLTIEHGVGANI